MAIQAANMQTAILHFNIIGALLLCRILWHRSGAYTKLVITNLGAKILHSQTYKLLMLVTLFDIS